MSELHEINRENSWLNPSDWVIKCPTSKISQRGNNLLHFNTQNQNYRKNFSVVKFYQSYLQPDKALELESDIQVLTHAVSCAKQKNKGSNGLYLEFGFCTGRSINFIAALAYDKTVYGFDSGKGLPKDWRPGFEKGKFAYIKGVDRAPFCPLDNTTLIMGEIEESLPIFKGKYLQSSVQLDFLHIDTDLYESAKTIFHHLGDFINPGKTVVVLDQGYNFWYLENLKDDSAFEKYELKAVREFAEERNFSIQFLAFNKNHQQLALIFKRPHHGRN